MLEVIYTWEIYTNDDNNVFLGYAYASNEHSAIQKSIETGGVASMYGQPAEKLTARKL